MFIQTHFIAAALVIAGIASASSSARADDPSDPPRVGTTAQLVSRAPGAPEGPTFPCDGECDIPVDQGRYNVVVRDADGHESTRKVVARSVGIVHVTEPHKDERDAGLAIGVVGSAAFAAGVLTLSTLVLSNSSSHGGEDYSALGPIGLVSLVASAVMLPVGWTMFIHSRKPQAYFTPYEVRRAGAAPEELHIGVKAGPGGGALAVGLVF